MKSVLAAREIEIPHTHNLGELSKLLVAATDIPISAALNDVDWLTPWGVTFRYDDPSISLDTDAGLAAAAAAIGLAEEILDEDRED